MLSKFLVASLAVASHATEPLTSLEGALFFEGFDDTWETRWVVSKDSKFTGTWKHATYSEPQGVKGDKGLEVGNEARQHAVSTVFKEAIDPKDKGIVVQYELHNKKTIQCGGAYIKLLTASDELSADGFTDASPYTIMFGPDKCGSTNKIHFIFRHKNPKTGEFEEKHYAMPPSPTMVENKTHLYTVIVGTDNTVKILVDNKEVSGKTKSLLKDGDFTPNVNPSEKIDDPEDKKPDSWIDSAMMTDPDSVKPETWNEDAPMMIVDPSAEKPEAWLDDAPEQVPDPAVAQPDDWDTEEDGDWEAPMIPNPSCEAPGGCGEWKAPEINNPDYKGKWNPASITNPDYIGVWAPQKIANPDYFYDEQPYAMTPIGGIGIELWTMQEGSLFDNILVANDPAVAEKAAKTFLAREEAEAAAEAARKASEPAPTEPAEEEPEEEEEEEKDEL